MKPYYRIIKIFIIFFTFTLLNGCADFFDDPYPVVGSEYVSGPFSRVNTCAKEQGDISFIYPNADVMNEYYSIDSDEGAIGYATISEMGGGDINAKNSSLNIVTFTSTSVNRDKISTLLKDCEDKFEKEKAQTPVLDFIGKVIKSAL